MFEAMTDDEVMCLDWIGRAPFRAQWVKDREDVKNALARLGLVQVAATKPDGDRFFEVTDDGVRAIASLADRIQRIVNRRRISADASAQRDVEVREAIVEVKKMAVACRGSITVEQWTRSLALAIGSTPGDMTRTELVRLAGACLARIEEIDGA